MVLYSFVVPDDSRPDLALLTGIGGGGVLLGMALADLAEAWQGRPYSLHLYRDDGSIQAGLGNLTAFLRHVDGAWRVVRLEVALGAAEVTLDGKSLTGLTVERLAERGARRRPIDETHQVWTVEDYVAYFVEDDAVVDVMLAWPRYDDDPATGDDAERARGQTALTTALAAIAA